jgi:hypothetical protein
MLLDTSGLLCLHHGAEPFHTQARAAKSGCDAGSGLGAVVTWVYAGIVGGAVDANPVSPVDPLAIWSDRAHGESAGDFDPSVLAPRDVPNLPRHLRQVLVLAENHGDIVYVLPGQPDHIDGYADVDALLFARKMAVFRSIGQVDDLVPVDQRPGVDGGPRRPRWASLLVQKWRQKGLSSRSGTPV